MYAFKDLLYLFIQICYFNKTLLLGGITLPFFFNIFVMQYFFNTCNQVLVCLFRKDNVVMFSISNNMIKLLKEFPHTDLINMCYSREMCVTRVIFSVRRGNNQAQYMEIKVLY